MCKVHTFGNSTTELESNKAPLLVLQIINTLSTGGAETIVRDYLIRVQGANIESRAICFWRTGSPFEMQLDKAGVQITYLSDSVPEWMKKTGLLVRPLTAIHNFNCLRETVRLWKPDAIHTHLSINHYVLFALGRRKVFGRNGNTLTLLHTVHNEPGRMWKPIDRGLETYIVRRLDFFSAKSLVKRHSMRFIALHEGMKEELNALFHVTNTVVINNGIDLTRFDVKYSRTELRKRYGIPQDAFVVGHVGRFAPQKNHAKILTVFDEICKRKPGAFLLLVGAGPMKEEINRNLESKGLSNRYTILSNRSDIPEIMACMDSFIFPSEYEGLGIVLIEAQVSGVPCVISDKVPSHAIISNIVRVRSLADSDAEWAQDVIDASPERIEYTGLDEWDIRNVVKRLEKLYRGNA